jgi:hypothetical protein
MSVPAPLSAFVVLRSRLACAAAVGGAAAALLLTAACSRKTEPAAPGSPGQSPAAPPEHAIVFADATRVSGLTFTHQLANGKLDNIMKSDGAGGVVLDYDGDGWMDVYLVNSGPVPGLSDAPAGTARSPNRLFRNRGDGTFEDVTARAGVEGAGFGTTAAAADYDNDGRTDLLVVNFGGLILYHNEGNGTFKDVTGPAGLTSRQAGISATFLDMDRDGYLDLFVANYLVFDPAIKPPAGANVPYPGPLSYEAEFNLLYRNRGDGTFEDVSERAGIRIPGHRAMSVTPLDYNADGNDDLYVSNDGTANLLLAGDGRGHFEEVALQSGVALNQFGQADGSMGASVGEVNGDGLPDLLVTRFGKASLYVNAPGGFFEDRIVASGILSVSSQYTGWGGNLVDFDNDGATDVFIADGDAHYLKGSPSLVLANDGKGNFVNVSDRAGPFFQQSWNLRGSGAVDFDNDGRMDLVLTSLGGPAVLLHNETKRAGHWLTLKLVGSRSNRDGFGAVVKVFAGGRTLQAEARCPTSYVFQGDPRLHFGLGAATKVDRVEIQWPSGRLQVLADPGIDRVVNIQEP